MSRSIVKPRSSELFWAMSDTRAMAGRNLRRIMRAPDQVMFTLISPLMFTLLFRYVFGGAIRGLDGINYVNYLIPGIAVQTAIFTASNTGFALVDDRDKGFIDRLRSLPMLRSAVLVGRVAADMLSNVAGLIVIVFVGFLVGFRPANLIGLLLGLLLVVTFATAVSFIFALVGLFASNVQTLTAATFPLLFPLTFASSAYVPTSTMPNWLQPFAQYQPVSILVDAVRALAIGNVPDFMRQALFLGESTTFLILQSLLWALVIGLGFGYLSVRRFNSIAS